MLTDKQERFVQELIKGKSQREAYKAAYNAENMKDKTCDDKASLLFKKEEIRARYEELRNKADEIAGLDAATVRAMLIKSELAVLNANPMDFYTMKEGYLGEPTLGLRDDVMQMDTSAVKKITFTRDGYPVFEFYDKQKAQDHLAEWFGIADARTDNKVTVVFQGADDYGD